MAPSYRRPDGGRTLRGQDPTQTRARRESLAVLLVVVLLLLVGVANVLWAAGVPSSANPARLPPSQDPFPLFPAASELHVLPVPTSANESERLTLLSIQGLVNRNRAELYLDVDNETGNASSMLTFLTQRYGITYGVVDLGWVYRHYLPSRSGIVVYDPARPESVNVVTMLSSLRGAVIAGPDTAAALHATYGLPILLDYAASNWTALDAIGAYDRALRELYPLLNSNLLAILPPDRLALRDYLIAARTFVFYDAQAPLGSPAELASTQRILAATPRNIPILGWFNTPTVTEENAFVQLASKYGKAIVGSQSVPNLSVLTALGRNEEHVQKGLQGPTLTLENKTYAVVAVPDGDNLDFVAGRMRTIWAEPERGTLPLAWSFSPLLADFAPPYMDLYYATASPYDRFVAGPSGAGYLYPDYLGAGDLAPYLQRTAQSLEASDLDVVWLLNAFPASEIPYRAETLSAYVDALHPRGLVLDYDDQPKTQDVWMQAGATAAVPVVRSTQLWTTMDNVYAKLGDAMATWDGGPHFLWITAYTFRFGLRDAKAMVAELSIRTGGNLVVVTPEQFFGLLEQDFLARARARLASLRSDPLASVLLAPALSSAASRLDDTAFGGAPFGPAYQGYLASTDLQGARLEEAVFILGIVVLLVSLVTLSDRRGGPRLGRSSLREARSFVLVAAAFALFLFAVRGSLAANFWSYQWIVAGVVLAGLGRPLRRYLDRTYPHAGLPAAVGLDLLFVALSVGTNVAFALAAIGTVAVLDAILARERVRPGSLVLALALGSAAGFLAEIGPLTFGVLGILLLAPLVTMRAEPRPGAVGSAKGGLVRGFVLTLPLAALAVASNYSLALRLDVQGPALQDATVALLGLGPIAGLLTARRWIASRTRAVQVLAFALGALFAAATGVTTGTVPTAVVLFSMVAALAVAAEATLRLFALCDPSVATAVTGAVPWIPLFLLFFRMPPVVYSLTLARLPEAVEAALYAPEFLFAASAAILALVAFRRHLRERSVAKGYRADLPLRGGGSP